MNTPVGRTRPSQLLWTYGPGALIDLPNLSVVTMGLYKWRPDYCEPIDEARLLRQVQHILGPQVSRLRKPPIEIENGDEGSLASSVPVKPFPRWYRCVRCGLLSPIDDKILELKPNRWKPEKTHYVHAGCTKGKNSDAVPARFLTACSHGHLDDFPWRWFVHDGPNDCRGSLYFFERDASLQTENLWVRCDCGAARSMVHAFGERGSRNLPACRGRFPHLDIFEQEECVHEPRAVLLGATNAWFPMTVSVLSIPPKGDGLQKYIDDGWEYFHDMESIEELRFNLKTFKKQGILNGIDTFLDTEIWAAIEAKRNGEPIPGSEDVDVKRPEWEVLTSEEAPYKWPYFMSERTNIPKGFEDLVDDVLLLTRLKEVNALIGFTRVDAPDDSMPIEERPRMASLTQGSIDWVPATEVHGEGIFIRFSEERLRRWENLPSVKERNQMIEKGHRGWRNARHLDPNTGYPGIRYVMMHTFAHLLIREMGLEAGYNSASIRERIYSSSDGDNAMAGVLIYTAAMDSDGTLGGLVELGKPKNLGRLIDQALKRAQLCSSDPLCSEHDPSEDRSTHAAACHACSFVAETSCEAGNRYLDRALLVETFESKDTSYFDGMKVPVESVNIVLENEEPVYRLSELTEKENTTGSISVKVPKEQILDGMNDDVVKFRYVNPGESVLEKGRVLILKHPKLHIGGVGESIVVCRLTKIRDTVAPESGEKFKTLEFKSGSKRGSLELTHDEFDGFTPIFVMED